METLSKMTDEQLVVVYTDGENNLAFDELLLRHQQSIYNYIFFNVKNSQLAEDIFQETFVKVIMSLKSGKYTETGRFRGWISRIAYNLIIDHYRKLKAENTISNDSLPIDLLNNQDLCDGTIEDALVQEQITKDIHKLIENLPESQREVLEMRYYQDLSFKDIAEQKNISINTALGRMRYAIINMRRMAKENDIILTM